MCRWFNKAENFCFIAVFSKNCLLLKKWKFVKIKRGSFIDFLSIFKEKQINFFRVIFFTFLDQKLTLIKKKILLARTGHFVACFDRYCFFGKKSMNFDFYKFSLFLAFWDHFTILQIGQLGGYYYTELYCVFYYHFSIFFLFSSNSTLGDVCARSLKIGRRFTSPSNIYLLLFFFVDVHLENFRRHQGSNPCHWGMGRTLIND
jgi:hypothetical protein